MSWRRSDWLNVIHHKYMNVCFFSPSPFLKMWKMLLPKSDFQIQARKAIFNKQWCFTMVMKEQNWGLVSTMYAKVEKQGNGQQDEATLACIWKSPNLATTFSTSLKMEMAYLWCISTNQISVRTCWLYKWWVLWIMCGNKIVWISGSHSQPLFSYWPSFFFFVGWTLMPSVNGRTLWSHWSSAELHHNSQDTERTRRSQKGLQQQGALHMAKEQKSTKSEYLSFRI